MKFKIIGSFILSLVFVMALLTTVLADDMNMDNGTKKDAGGINAELSFKNGKAQTGNGDIMITLLDSDKKPITDAEVQATAEMDKNMDMNMDKSKPIAIEFEKGDDQGRYMGKVNFTDKGKWIVKATIKDQGQEKNVDFDVDVAGTGPNWGIIGGFLVLMVLIIGIAAAKKKKTAKA
jgi:hypothetical protein